MKFDVIFSNKPSTLNKKLVKFFQLNLLSLNKSSIIFNFEVAHPNEMNKYVAKGIKNYPILIFDDKSVTGVEKIITYLKGLVKKHNDKILNKSDDEHVSDFWKDTIGKGDEDDDNEGDESDNLHKKIQEAFESRNDTSILSGGKKYSNSDKSNKSNNTSSVNSNNDEKPSETLKKMGNSMDDELMAKFFENQGEGLDE